MRQHYSILYVAYPLLPVSHDSAGGAEQILWSLEQEMTRRGHSTAVAACESSRVQGELLATGRAPETEDRLEERQELHTRKTLEFLKDRSFDVIHDHSGYFWKHAAEVDVPVLATLHLPRDFYRPELFEKVAANVSFNCVSHSQKAMFSDLPQMRAVVENGVDVGRFPFARRKDDYLLWLGRICPEKAPHLAIEVARKAGMKLVLAGKVYPFSYHRLYFEREVEPLLKAYGSQIEFVDSPSIERKTELLRCARALLVTSLAPETSSLVSLEAMACGTPVVAFRRGALPEVIRHGHTGFTVKTVEDMVAAIHDVHHIWPDECREYVKERFSAERMASGYETLYSEVLNSQRRHLLAA